MKAKKKLVRHAAALYEEAARLEALADEMMREAKVTSVVAGPKNRPTLVMTLHDELDDKQPAARPGTSR